MSERIKNGSEQFEQHIPSPESTHHRHEKGSERHPEVGEHKHKQNIEKIRDIAHEEAKSTAESVDQGTTESHAGQQAAFVNKELKDIAYQRTMSRVRRQLSPVGRSFSQFIHQPVVDKISEGAAKTVGRPSGLFGGGLVALVGTTIYYYISRHYGYDYNYLIFLMLLAGGFILGWVGEILWRLTRLNK